MNTPNGSVDTKRPPDNTSGRDLLVQSTDVIAETAVATEDDGVAAETVEVTRVAMMIEIAVGTTTGIEDAAATMIATVDAVATIGTTDDAASATAFGTRDLDWHLLPPDMRNTADLSTRFET